MEYKSSELTSKYLRSRKIPSTACSGCGLGMNHKIVIQAIKELGLDVADVVWGTSIGCAGRQTFATWKGDGFAGTHGRVYAIARGLRIALPPEKHLILTVGDGDLSDSASVTVRVSGPEDGGDGGVPDAGFDAQTLETARDMCEAFGNFTPSFLQRQFRITLARARELSAAVTKAITASRRVVLAIMRFNFI